MHTPLPMRERAVQILENTRYRLDSIVPSAMRESDLDMWIVICFEDVLDPVFRTMIPLDTWCPILQLLVFVNDGGGGPGRRLNISGTDTADLFERPYTGQVVEKQWEMLIELIIDNDPTRIGINIGDVAWSASGLTRTLHQRLFDKLPAKYRKRVVSAEKCAVRYLSELGPGDLTAFEESTVISHEIIESCYSARSITPGVTTVDDLTWIYWQRVADLGLAVSFRPSFYLVRGREARESYGPEDRVIRPGDFVRCDVGLEYLRLNSDQQRWCYCPRPGETDAPAEARELMVQANRLQDLFRDELQEGLTGNEVLHRVLASAREAGAPNPKVFSHSIGLFVHEPGALIGLPWQQTAITGRGDAPVIANSGYAMELSVERVIEGWGPFTMSLEEDVVRLPHEVRILGGRQEEFIII